jgi:hypothetical protein
MIRKHILSWFGLLCIAMLNGALRDFAYKSFVGDLVSHQISCVTGILLFGIFIWFIGKRWPLASANQAWMIGFIWLAMTMCFEFLFFHYVRGITWEVLLHDYDVLEGRLWILILIWVTIAPRVMWGWRKKSLSR